MEKPIKISIITPSFNQSEYIDRTIKSVLDQDYLNLEYIIMDGGSNDGTIDVIKKYEPRLAFWKSEKDRGQVNAINNGLNQSTGEIVGWLNSDDVYKEGTLSLIADYFEFNPEVDIVYGNSDIIDAVDNKIGKYISETPSFIKWAYKGQIFVSQPSLFFRRRVFDTLGLLDESLPINFDHDYWFRALLNRFHMEYVNKTFSSLRWHTETISFKATGKHRHLHLLILRKNKILAARVFYYIRYIILVGVKKKLFGDIKLFPKRINVGDQFFTKQAIAKKEYCLSIKPEC